MLLFEVMNTSTTVKWIINQPDYRVGNFEVDGQIYTLAFSSSKIQNDELEVEVNFTNAESGWDRTNTSKNQLVILGTVFNETERFIKEVQPKVITGYGEATDKSRNQVYSRLIQKMARRVQYSVDSVNLTPDGYQYTLIRNN